MKKILGILICIMLMTTFLTVAKNVDTVNKEQMIDEDSNTSSFDDCVDVPVWEIGHWWKYKIEEIDISLEKENLSIDIYGEIDDLTFEVIDDTGGYYQLEIHQVEIRGNYAFFVDIGYGPINISGTLLHLLKPTTLEGSILLNKSDLGIKQFNPKISGRLTVDNILLSIPGTIDLHTHFDFPYAIIDFPFCVNQPWSLPASNVTFNGTIQSLWLRVLYLLNKTLGRIFPPDPGVIPYLELLPDVNIGKLLKLIYGTNVFHIPELLDIIICRNTEMITVPAGPFLAYNITINGMDGVANMYYAPEAGNLIKIAGNFEDVLPSISNICAELIDTNFGR